MVTCAFESRGCTRAIATSGGFDRHHEWPKFLGGAEGQTTMLTLCPNHHRRQHALLRTLVEAHLAGKTVPYRVLRRFSVRERDAARFAIENWIKAGARPPATWGVDAAS